MQENENGVDTGGKGGVEGADLRVYLCLDTGVYLIPTIGCHEYDCCLGKQMELKERDKK